MSSVEERSLLSEDPEAELETVELPLPDATLGDKEGARKFVGAVTSAVGPAVGCAGALGAGEGQTVGTREGETEEPSVDELP